MPHQSSAHKGSQQTPTIIRLAPCFRRKRATAAPGNITHLLANVAASCITLHRAAEGASACLPGDKHRNPRYILRRAVASKAQTKQSSPSSVCCAKYRRPQLLFPEKPDWSCSPMGFPVQETSSAAWRRQFCDPVHGFV
eukprot:g16298.t1